MRIPFYKTTSTTDSKLIDIARQYDVVSQTYPSLAMSFDNLTINDVQSYTDDARYHLDIFEINVDRCYNKQSVANENDKLIKNAKIQVFAIKFDFNMDISFRLFQDNWTDYWRTNKDDVTIHLIQPLVECYGSTDMGYHIFKSLFTSYIIKTLELIHTNHIMCVKRNDMLIFAYGVEDQATYNGRNQILDLFLDAIYEMVKVTSGRGYYTIADNKYYNEINVKQQYDERRLRAKLTKKSKTFVPYNQSLLD